MDAFDRLRRHLKGPPKVTQLKFALATGLSQSQVCLIAQGKMIPPVDRIPAINGKVGTSFEDWTRAAAALRRARKAS